MKRDEVFNIKFKCFIIHLFYCVNNYQIAWQLSITFIHSKNFHPSQHQHPFQVKKFHSYTHSLKLLPLKYQVCLSDRFQLWAIHLSALLKAFAIKVSFWPVSNAVGIGTLFTEFGNLWKSYRCYSLQMLYALLSSIILYFSIIVSKFSFLQLTVIK